MKSATKSLAVFAALLLTHSSYAKDALSLEIPTDDMPPSLPSPNIQVKVPTRAAQAKGPMIPLAPHSACESVRWDGFYFLHPIPADDLADDIMVAEVVAQEPFHFLVRVAPFFAPGRTQGTAWKHVKILSQNPHWCAVEMSEATLHPWAPWLHELFIVTDVSEEGDFHLSALKSDEQGQVSVIPTYDFQRQE